MKYVFSIFVVLFVAFQAEADNCRAVAKAVVVTPTVAVATFFPVFVPTYTASYIPPPVAYTQGAAAVPAPHQTAQPPACEQELATLKARLAELEKRLSPTPPQVQPPAGQAKGLAIMQARCASCHEEKVAQGKGSSFVLFKGNGLSSLDSAAQNKVLRNVYTGRMPKNGTLTDAEVAEVIGFLDTLK